MSLSNLWPMFLLVLSFLGLAVAAMAVGVISLGVGTVLYVTAPKSADPATAARRFDVAPLQGGGFATYAGTL